MLVLKAFLFPKQRIVVIYDARNCDLGDLVPAFWHPEGSLWWHPGSPSEQQEGHVVVWTRNLSDFGIIIWELQFDRCLGTKG